MKKSNYCSFLLFLILCPFNFADSFAQYRTELKFVKPNVVHVHQTHLGRDQREAVLIPTEVEVGRVTETRTFYYDSSSDSIKTEKLKVEDEFTSTDLRVYVNGSGTVQIGKVGETPFLRQNYTSYIDNPDRLEYSVIFPMVPIDSIFEVLDDNTKKVFEPGNKQYDNCPVLLMAGVWGIVWGKSEVTELKTTSSYINFKSKQKYLDFYVVYGENDETIVEGIRKAVSMLDD